MSGFFSIGIDAEAGRTAVGRQHHPAVAPGPNEAEAALAVMELAEARAQLALNPAIAKWTPEACLKIFLHNAHRNHISMILAADFRLLPRELASWVRQGSDS